MDDKQRKLFNFLDDRAFQPILNKDADDYSGEKRQKFEDVKRATQSERERYQNYSSAQELYRNFHDDLTSDEAVEVNRKLDDLNLPKLADFEKQFDERASEVGVDT